MTLRFVNEKSEQNYILKNYETNARSYFYEGIKHCRKRFFTHKRNHNQMPAHTCFGLIEGKFFFQKNQ
jgi:hypothetical protein